MPKRANGLSATEIIISLIMNLTRTELTLNLLRAGSTATV